MVASDVTFVEPRLSEFGRKKSGRMEGLLGSWITRTLPAFAFRMKALERQAARMAPRKYGNRR